MKKKLISLSIIGLFISCKSDNIIDCSTVLCAAPMIVINLVDDNSQENIIIQNNISNESIAITDISQNTVEFSINENSGLLYAEKQTTEGSFELQIDSEIIANISFNTSTPNTNECCDYGELKNVFVENKTFKVEDNVIIIYL